ncbi:MAG: T9SS type A sorting domain-containing protein, partial [Bacteroidia bacterium]|nr:T9SS type A sorting domain-containing protein [Bacteroidia bacterium]
GTAPYTYSWNTVPAQTGTSISGLTASTYQVTVVDSEGCTGFAIVIVGEPDTTCANFRTETVTSWNVVPDSMNAGFYLSQHFPFAFPGGLTIGGANTLHLTSVTAVKMFLPSSGPMMPLTMNLSNPTSVTYGNTLAAELVALTLNMRFDQYDPNWAPGSGTVLGQLEILSGDFTGWTVKQLADSANAHLGGMSTSYTGLQYATAIAAVNANYLDGADNGFLGCPGTVIKPQGPNTGWNFDMIAYPNPTHGNLYVEMNSDVNEQYVLTVRDITGRIMHTEADYMEIGVNNRTYDFSGYAKGVYFVHVQIADYKETIRIIVQ